jgi:Ca-activated chloride channel family protein
MLLFLPVAIAFLAFSPSKTITITGTITDEKGSPLPAVSVMIKGTRVGTSADNQGKYRISTTDENGTIVFSGVGLGMVEEKIAGRTIINVIMKRQVLNATEVVVTALGQTRQAKELGYSTTRVLSGKVPGLTVVSGDMGSYYRTDVDEELLSREGYDHISENRFLKTTDNPLSTFSIDVDAASYSNVRRFISQGQLPPAGAVRVEEMINYFHYEYPQPSGDTPFSINTEITDAPWNKEHKLVLIGLQGKKISADNLPPSNLVFLIDVSGSMSGPSRLGLVKSSLKMLVDQLRQQDHVSIVVYAGNAGLVLKPTSGSDKMTIKNAIDNLEAGGSTAGGEGIKLAYKTARENFLKSGNNRVILCTDGDFNVGVSSNDELVSMVEEERKSGVFLTVLGYGMGNYQDNKMQLLADKGNGNHAYIDGISEAKKVLVNEFGGTLFTIAKDVKLQVEFNPAKVQGYRLIGYENRMLAKEDFNDDKKDAGEMGSGHTVTALYEVIPVGVKSDFLNNVDPLKYQSAPEKFSETNHDDEILTVKFRYKAPDGEVSKLIEQPVNDDHVSLTASSENLRFAAAVAEFGMLLRNSEFRSASSFANVLGLATTARGKDEEGYRSEFIKMVQSAELLAKTKTTDKDTGHTKETNPGSFGKN